MPVESSGEKSLEPLKKLLVEEIQAVNAYKTALVALKDSTLYDLLLECQRSHARRAHRLTEIIAETWGREAVPKLTGAESWERGENPISNLFKGETKTLRTYHDVLSELQGPSKELAIWELIPQQEKSHLILQHMHGS
jgi:rubrerythrin